MDSGCDATVYTGFITSPCPQNVDGHLMPTGTWFAQWFILHRKKNIYIDLTQPLKLPATYSNNTTKFLMVM